MIKQTTATLTSAYIIKTNEKDEKSDQFELSIVSDVGNKYVMVIDFKNNNVRFIYESEGKVYMVHHTIKKSVVL